jgi:hypothetical protein
MNDVHEALPQVQIKWGELTLSMFPPGYDAQGLYAFYLESCVIRLTCAHRRDYLPDVFKMQLGEISSQFAAKKCNWGSQIWQDSLDDEDHSKKLAFLILTQEKTPGSGPINPDVTEELIEQIWKEPYKDEGDMYFQVALANGIAPTFGGKMVNAIFGFLSRPNLSTPPAAGKPANTPS